MDDLKSLPTVREDYKAEKDNNENQVSSLFDQLYPNLNIPHNDIYMLLTYLDQTNVNPLVLPRIIRGIQNILIGTGQGEVLIHVRGETLTVEARERDVQINTKQVDTNV